MKIGVGLTLSAVLLLGCKPGGAPYGGGWNDVCDGR